MVIKGPKDAKNVLDIFKKDRKYIFLGASKSTSSSPFKWFDGTPVDQFNNWAEDQPDSPHSQYCLRMDWDDGSKWRDIECGSESNFAVICQQNKPNTGCKLCESRGSIFVINITYYNK